MKITTFNPKIVTKDAQALVDLFEKLGFEKRHEVTLVDGVNITNYRMSDPDGNKVDISDYENLPQDVMAIRMNVDNFEEAYDLLITNGFKQVKDIVETRSSKTVMMAAPSGFMIDLCLHIK
ncbi:MAG: hypothetical protein IJI66_10130 [Erysipelotrichaceae bacterium]|nr:hypothetical protein [Erysipelotrichaceae bacterium]